jgi:uncharacterized membrane protein
MKIYIVPKTRLGKWSMWLIVVFILLFITFQLLVASGQRGGDTFLSNLTLSIPILTAGICGIAAFITGIISIIKSKERSVLVFIASIIGLFVLMFVSGEFLAPH